MAFSLDDYAILEEIGQGGFATVYRAMQKSLDKEVAIKCLSPVKTQNSEQIVRFRREAEAMAALNHDNIVSILDYAYYNGSYYIVMEYIRGMTLTSALEKGLAREGALCVMEKISSAIKAAHDRSIVHRDIKPANILLGKSGQIKLADFGLALFPGGIDFQTAAGSVLGTLRYLAPEALVSPREADARVDIFALGCILYRILTGRLPFDGSSVGEVSYRILNEKPAPIEHPDAFARVTLRCLEKERDQRPGIDEVHNEIQSVIADKYHACSEVLFSFVRENEENGKVSGPTPNASRPAVSPGKKNTPSTLVIRSFAVAALGAGLIILFFLLPELGKHEKADLPRMPEAPVSVDCGTAMPQATIEKRAIDGPAPLADDPSEMAAGMIRLKGMAANDTVLLNGRNVTVRREGTEGRISAAPGTYILEIRRKTGAIITRTIELLPYERITIDVKRERIGNAPNSTR